jgi:hypothetical protein
MTGDGHQDGTRTTPPPRTHYRFPRISDRKLDFVVLAATAAAVVVVPMAFVPAPWRNPLIVLALAFVAETALQARRQYCSASSSIVRNHDEATARDALIQQHVTVTSEAYLVACKYCGWRTNDYARRLVDAPRHLHDGHPSRDPRIPSTLDGVAWVPGHSGIVTIDRVAVTRRIDHEATQPGRRAHQKEF